VVVKVSKPGQDIALTVPVIGLPTIEQMRVRARLLSRWDAGQTLFFDRAKLIELADGAGIAIQAFLRPPAPEPNDASRE